MAKNIKGIIVKLGLDGKAVSKELDVIDKQARKSTEELKAIDRALKLDPKNTELLGQKYEVLTEKLELARQRLQQLNSLQEHATKALANNSEWARAYEPLAQEIDKVDQKLRKLQQQKDSMDEKLASGEITQGAYDEYISELEKTKEEMKELERRKAELDASFEDGHFTADEFRAYRREVAQVSAEIEQLERQTAELDGATDQSSRAFRRAVESTREYRQAMGELEKSSAELRNKLGSALNDIWNLSLKIAKGISAAAVAAGAAAVKVGSDFDASMSVVSAYSKASAEDFESLREAAREMGATTSKTASEAADALSYMALAGWDTEKMLGGLEPMLRASEAANADLGQISDLVTDSMSAMGISVEELTHYLDVCAEAQSDSNTSMTQLLQAYVASGGMFRNLNATMEESAAILGVLANRGIKGAEAGNSINSILINLIGANKNAAKAMDVLGVSAYDANGNFIGVTETLRVLSEALETASEQDKNLFTAKIGGKTQYDTLMALLNGINEEYDDLYANISDSNGALERTSLIMKDNLKGDLELLTSAFADLGIEVNDTFTQAFREAVQVSTEEVGRLTHAVSDGELGESLRKIAEAFGKAIEQIAEFAANKAIPKTIEFFEYITDHGAQVKALIVAIGAAFVAWRIADIVNAGIKAVTKFKRAVDSGASATKALTKALGANPWVLLATAVAAVAAGLITFALNADTANNRIRDYRKEIKELDKEVQNLSDTTQKSINRSEAEIAVIENKAKEYEELRKEAHRTAEQEEHLKDLANELQQYMPDSTKLIDEQTGAYNSLAGAIDGAVRSMKKNAYVQAYNDQMTELVSKQIEAKATLEKLQKEFDAVDSRLRSKGAHETESGNFGFDSLTDAIANMGDLSTWEKAKQAIEQAQRSIESYENEIDNLGDKIDDVYKEHGLVDFAGPEQASYYERKGKESTEAARQIAEKNAQEAADAEAGVWEDFLAQMEDLDYRKAIHDIDENSYWQERRRILSENLFKESEEWWDFYDKTEDYFAKQTEQQAKDREDAYKQERDDLKKSIEEQIDLVKEKQELNSEFTEKMMYDEMETIISGLDKESELYKKYNSEILKGRKALNDETVKLDKDAQKALIDNAAQTAKSIATEYNSRMSEITSKQEAYKNKLLGMAELYTSEKKKDKSGNETEVFTLENIDKQIKAVEEYDNKLKKLSARGAGDNLVGYIEGLSEEDADKVMHVLNSMSDSQLKAYSDKYDKLLDTVNERAESRYAPEVEAVNKGFIDKIMEAADGLPPEMRRAGREAIRGFIDGFTGNDTELIDAVADKFGDVLEGFKTSVDSGGVLKEVEDAGERTALSFAKGMKKTPGADMALQITDDFIAMMAEKDKDLYNALHGAFAGNASKAMEAVGDLPQIISSLVLPDLTKLKLPKITQPSASEARAEARQEQTAQRIENAAGEISSAVNLLSAIMSGDRTTRVDLNEVIQVMLDGDTLTEVVNKKLIEKKRRGGA